MAEKNEVKDAYPPQSVKNLQNIFILTKMFLKMRSIIHCHPVFKNISLEQLLRTFEVLVFSETRSILPAHNDISYFLGY